VRIQDNRWRTKPELWKKLKLLAHENRHRHTEAEKKLWEHLKRRQLNSFIFRRQHNIGPFIVDFYCYSARLIVEVDGEIHQYKLEEDKTRQEYLESLHLKVIRFSNNDVLNKTDTVLLQIKKYLSTTV
jgi:very-short-patch-repair endonuclease